MCNSPYDEDLSVMAARFEALMTFLPDNEERKSKLFKLGLKILQKSVNVLMENSVLGAYLGLADTAETASVQQTI